MKLCLKESNSSVADRIWGVVNNQGFWTRDNEFEESMNKAGLTVDYMDSESADISDPSLEGFCRVTFNRGGRSFTISDIICFDESGNRVECDDEEEFYESYMYEGYSIDDDLQDIWDFVQEQEYDSALTSQNQLPGGVKAAAGVLKPGTINLDYGGGKYDQAIEYLKGLDIINLVFDPFNRTKEHNKEVLDVIREAGGADSCTCCNVLNVIDGDVAKLTALRNMKRLVKTGGKIYIQTYEGSDKVEVEDEKTGKRKKKASGVGKVTTKGWQENKETKMYLPIVKKVFPDAEYKSMKSGKGSVPMIVCTA